MTTQTARASRSSGRKQRVELEIIELLEIIARASVWQRRRRRRTASSALCSARAHRWARAIQFTACELRTASIEHRSSEAARSNPNTGECQRGCANPPIRLRGEARRGDARELRCPARGRRYIAPLANEFVKAMRREGLLDGESRVALPTAGSALAPLAGGRDRATNRIAVVSQSSRASRARLCSPVEFSSPAERMKRAMISLITAMLIITINTCRCAPNLLRATLFQFRSLRLLFLAI